jgi:hypothetical protein
VVEGWPLGVLRAGGEGVKITLDTDDHDIHDLIRYLDGDHHMGVYDRAKVVADIKAQLTGPPTEWGSIVRARIEGHQSPVLLTYVPEPEEYSPTKFSWYSERDSWHSWEDLTGVEVLRVGVGGE